MTNVPFGFSMPGPDENGREGRDGEPAAGPAGFDLSQLGAMLSQLGQMVSSAATTPGAAAGPVNYDLARQLATSQLPATHPASSVDVAQVRDAVGLAEVWLDGVTAFPAGARTVTAWTPRQWVEQTMPNWEQLCSPIAERVSGAWVDGLPDGLREQAGPLLAMMGSMGGMAFGSQLGQGLGQLAPEVVTSTDIGLPLGPDGTAALLPLAVRSFAQGLDQPEDQVRLFLAAREAAHHRLYAAVPWLRARLLELVAAYAHGITVDFSAMENLAASFDPGNPGAIEALMGQGGLEPTITPGQQATLMDLETLLAQVEGWVDTVVADAVGARLPGAPALQETLRRRRASGGPAEQTFATLIGLELRPRRLRAAADLWRSLTASRGPEGRDALWSHPDLLPAAADLDDPAGFLDRDRQFNEMLADLGDLDDPADLDQIGGAGPESKRGSGLDGPAAHHGPALDPDPGERGLGERDSGPDADGENDPPDGSDRQGR